MRRAMLDPSHHDPQDPNPWLAIYLDSSLPIHDAVKRAWLADCSSASRQWLMPFVRPLARLAVIGVQLLKLLLPRAATSSTLLHRLLARCLSWFVTPEANWLILRHFHVGADNLAWLNANLAEGAIALDRLRPTRVEELRDHLFVRHDINLYNFLIELNLRRKGAPIARREAHTLDFRAVPDDGAAAVRLEDMPNGWFNVIDLQTAIELFTPVYALFLRDEDFWRAAHSLQLDETIAAYAAQLTGRNDALAYVNNRHPMVPDVTYHAAYRLLLHGLATEVMHAMLVQWKGQFGARQTAPQCEPAPLSRELAAPVCIRVE
jgi:hypothetical protein